MRKAIAAKPKKRGRPATGRYPMIGLRASPELRGLIEQWASREADTPSLSEAIRRLVELGLTVKAEHRPSGEALLARSGKASKASDMAGRTVDKVSDLMASTEENADRKRRLIKGPSEFRGMRDRAAKKRDRK
jgi:hypothetical protein